MTFQVRAKTDNGTSGHVSQSITLNEPSGLDPLVLACRPHGRDRVRERGFRAELSAAFSSSNYVASTALAIEARPNLRVTNSGLSVDISYEIDQVREGTTIGPTGIRIDVTPDAGDSDFVEGVIYDFNV